MTIKRFIPDQLTIDDGVTVVEKKVENFEKGISQAFPERQPEQVAPIQQEPVQPQNINVYTEKDIQDSRLAGYEDGYAKGYNAAKSESDTLDEEIKSSLQAIQKSLSEIKTNIQSADERYASDVMQLVSEMVKKISHIELKDKNFEVVETTVRKVLRLLFEEPIITINVNSKMVGQLVSKLDEIIKSEGFDGKVDIKGSNQIHPGDCNISWHGGGVKREKAEILNEIENMAGKISFSDNI